LEAKVNFLQQSIEVLAGSSLSSAGRSAASAPPMLDPLHQQATTAPGSPGAPSFGQAIAARLAAGAGARGGARTGPVAGVGGCEGCAEEESMEDLIENLNQVGKNFKNVTAVFHLELEVNGCHQFSRGGGRVFFVISLCHMLCRSPT
jgi:hypothetical protein